MAQAAGMDTKVYKKKHPRPTRAAATRIMQAEISIPSSPIKEGHLCWLAKRRK